MIHYSINPAQPTKLAPCLRTNDNLVFAGLANRRALANFEKKETFGTPDGPSSLRSPR